MIEEHSPPEKTPPAIDLEEVSRLVDAMEQDLAKARTDSSQVHALRAGVEQLRAALEPGTVEPEKVQLELTGLRERLHRLNNELLSDAFEGSRYITQIGRILGL